MKLNTSINGKHIVTPEASSAGHLGAHINLENREDGETPKMDISFLGNDTTDSEEAKYLKWQGKSLAAGDLDTVKVMPATPSDSPAEVISSLRNGKVISVTNNQVEKLLMVAMNYSANCFNN